MKLELPKPGVYVVAVSGGVDSIVLLDLAAKLHEEDPGYKFVVAHLDHGIRYDSVIDRHNVERQAKKHNLPFIFNKLELGKVSEDTARQARYDFLGSVAKNSQAEAILTAHHEDDLIETAIINIIRGTGRKGLTSLINNKKVLRPLIKHNKREFINYAVVNKLKWRDDITNKDEDYLRNYIRINLSPKMPASTRIKFLGLIHSTSTVNKELDDLIDNLLSKSKDKSIDRVWFNSLSHKVALEVLAQWLRNNGLRSFSKSTLERLVVDAKIGSTGQIFPVQNHINLRIYKDRLALYAPER